MTWNIDLDLDKGIDPWKKVYLTYIIETCKNIRIGRTRRGFHIRNIPKHLEYLRSLVDCPGRIKLEEIKARMGRRRFVLFHHKAKIIVRKGKVILKDKYDEEVVDKNVLLQLL